ncbi:phospholipase D-like domain-containing protein [Luteipulveratus sp. YIM 133132]|uniref:phospholipase D-like domain-containing protein n=1 Tax=Luteipulveratus flavus TaxID=3031728 RepID=UPI0023B09A0C|nr:phospholipase D-like domain-containing protein [Luteipulveratus sp. YIM 133132]MDE9366278.1 phospholipase D-like domain-containing protein [Luteipulveratus sp. YIM 133132]
MRASVVAHGLRVHAVAGTHTVLLGMDLDAPAGCLGFGIRRVDHTEHEAYWLRGMKTFRSIVPDPTPGSDWSTAVHPVQGFQWGDYTAKPAHDYTYEVSALGGRPGALTPLATTAVDVRTEDEDDGRHGIWFNRGVAGSQAYAKRFAGLRPRSARDESDPAMVWLSRGLGEAFVAFCGEAATSAWSLRGAFYEFTWRTGLEALGAARDRGADVALVVHGRSRADDDTTAADARQAAATAGLSAAITWRDARNVSALMHDKFLVLLHEGRPVAVWTGSTNLTQGAVFGHSNVGHVIRDPAVAAAFLQEWERLRSPATTAELRTEHAGENQVHDTVPAPRGVVPVFSPRGPQVDVLGWYARLFDSATTSSHITGAFGLNAVFRETLQHDKDVVRTVLLDKPPPAKDRVPTSDPDVRVSTGAHLADGPLEQWAGERLTGFNTHVRYIHTKIILIDPLTDDPTVLTGSANYSVASTGTNEENTVVIRGDADSADAVRRVADIYLTEYHRLFMHFVFRAWAQRRHTGAAARSDGVGHLSETDAWTAPYYRSGSWRQRQRLVLSGQSG